jgi:hypothetical protein
MKPTSEEYYFFEWLILGKNMTEERFKKLTSKELLALQMEYDIFKKNMK